MSKNVIRVTILKREDTFNQIVEFGSYNWRSLHKNTIIVKKSSTRAMLRNTVDKSGTSMFAGLTGTSTILLCVW